MSGLGSTAAMLVALGAVKTCVVGYSSITVLLMQATQLSQLQDERASQQQVLSPMPPHAMAIRFQVSWTQ